MKHWQDEGSEPDYRFSLANERTFLAWIRTALALIAGGVLLSHLIEASGALVSLLSSLLAMGGAALGGAAFYRWKGNEMAMRHSRPLPRSIIFALLAAGTLVVAVIAAVMLLRT